MARKNPPTKSYLRHKAAQESSPEYIAQRKREQESEARASERLESLETLYEEQTSEAARLNAQAFTEDEVTAFVDYCLSTTHGWPEWMILGSEATANLDTYSGTGTSGEDGSVGLALWFKGGVFSVRAAAFNRSPLIGTPYIINGNSNTITVASPLNVELREKDPLHFEPFTDSEIDDLLQFQLTLVRADDLWYAPWEPGVPAAFAEVQKNGRIPGLPKGPPSGAANLAEWRIGSRKNPTDAPEATVYVYQLGHEPAAMDPLTIRNIRALTKTYEDLSLALDAAKAETGIDRWVVVAEDEDRVFMSVQDSEFVEMTENVDEGSSWRDCLEMLLPEPRGNPTDAPPAWVFVYRLETHSVWGITPVLLPEKGHTLKAFADYERLDLAQALDFGEDVKDIDSWVIVTDYHRWFMSVRDSDFVEVTEQTLTMSVRQILEELTGELVQLYARENPDEEHGPVDEESDVPDRYKEIFHKRMAEAEASKTESRAATVASVKKALKLPKKNPNPNFETGDKVRHVKGPKGIVKAKLKNTFGTWDPDRVQVKWDSGEETGCETRNLIKLPKQNPDEDEIDPRYVGWEISDDEEAPRENGKINQPDYRYYVVDRTNKVILAGNEYREDAEDVLREMDTDVSPSRHLSILRFPGRIGLDPDNDRSWEVNVPEPVWVCVYRLDQQQAFNREYHSTYLHNHALLTREKYRDLPEAMIEAEKLRDLNTLVTVDAEGPVWFVSAGDSEFQRFERIVGDTTRGVTSPPTWPEIIERLLNG